MSYGDWAQWNRRLKLQSEEGIVMGVTCSEHPTLQLCDCLSSEREDWDARHGVSDFKLVSKEEAGKRFAGMQL